MENADQTYKQTQFGWFESRQFVSEFDSNKITINGDIDMSEVEGAYDPDYDNEMNPDKQELGVKTDLNRVKKLAGIPHDMSDKGDMHDALNDVQNTIDGAMQGLQKGVVQVTDEIQKTLYTDESVEEMSDLDRIKQFDSRNVKNFDPDDMYGKVRRHGYERRIRRRSYRRTN